MKPPPVVNRSISMYPNGECPNCGSPLIGDGHSVVLHCENAEPESYEYHEPDAQPVFCANAENSENEDHHAMMNGPRIAQSLPNEYMESLLKAASPTITVGWFCTLLHDFPEPEGIVWFNGRPQPGMRFKLPSSNFLDEWEVKSVNDDEMSFTAVKPN